MTGKHPDAPLPEHKDALIAQRRRGEEANRIMSDPFLVEAIAGIHKELEATIWQNGVEPERILAAVQAGKLLRHIEQHIREHIETGQFAKDSLNLLEDD